MELLLAFVLLEIFADPPGSDNNQEFVEFSFTYVHFETNNTNESINESSHQLVNQSINHSTNKSINQLTNQSINNFSDIELLFRNITFADAASNDTLEYITTIGDMNSSEQFVLIVEEDFNYSQIRTNNTCHIFSAGATIGNNLGNDKDTITLYGDEILINESYETFGCAQGENCSLQKHNNSFIAKEPNPCNFEPFVEQKNVSSCPLNLSIDSQVLYELGDAIQFTPKIIGTNYTLLYWWENLYGDILKKPVSTTNDNPKQFTPKQPDDERDFVVVLQAELENHCNSTSASSFAIVKGESRESTSSSGSSSDSSNRGSGGSSNSLSFQKPQFTFSSPKTSYENISLTTTLYYPQQEGIFQVAMYAYRGSTNFSSREAINITVNEMNVSHKTLALEPGNYSVKTQVWFPGRKTPEEERREIIILETPQTIIQKSEEQTKEQSNEETPIQGNTVQESDFTIPWFGLLFGLGLAIVAFIRHRNAGSENETPQLQSQDLPDQNQESVSEKNTTLHTWIAKEKNPRDVAHQTS